MSVCRYCKGTGKITLFTSVVDCECVTKQHYELKEIEIYNIKMVLIPSGTFEMGSNKEGEFPKHTVKIEPFYLSKYLITQKQWINIIGNNPSKFTGNKNLPVDSVSWKDCQSFCRTINEKINKNLRLPSEAEWEYACRAGTITKYNTGDTIDKTQACFNYNKTVPVGSYVSNAFGLYDMHGNLWEWCEDIWHNNYHEAPLDGSAWVTGGDQGRRVLRGGSWLYDEILLRSSYRGGGRPDSRSVVIGFRLAAGMDIIKDIC